MTGEGGPGRIVFEGEPVTHGAEPLLSGTEDDVELVDALAALTGAVTIGGDSVNFQEGAAITFTNGSTVTVSNGSNLNVDDGSSLQLTGDSSLSNTGTSTLASINVSGNCDFNTAAGTTDFLGPVTMQDHILCQSTVEMSGLPEADADPNYLWKDPASGLNIVKVSG